MGKKERKSTLAGATLLGRRIIGSSNKKKLEQQQQQNQHQQYNTDDNTSDDNNDELYIDGKSSSAGSRKSNSKKGGGKKDKDKDKKQLKKNGGKNKKRNNQYHLRNVDIEFRHAIEADGTKTVIEMAADGNCLFRALSDQLFYDYGNQHTDVRYDIVEYMERNKDDFVVFLVLNDKESIEGEDAEDFEGYCADMRNDGTWGGNLELVAASKVYRRNITVFSSTLAAFTIHHENKKGSSGPDLLLSYHDNDHYNSVRLNNVSRSKLPAVKGYSRSPRASTTNADLTSSTTTSSNSCASSTNASTCLGISLNNNKNNSTKSSRGVDVDAMLQHQVSTTPQSVLTENTDAGYYNDSKHMMQQQQNEKDEEMSATETESSRLSGSTTGTTGTDVTALTGSTSVATSCVSFLSNGTEETANTWSGQGSIGSTSSSTKNTNSKKEKKRSISRINIIRGYRRFNSDDDISVDNITAASDDDRVVDKVICKNDDDDDDTKKNIGDDNETVRTSESSRKSTRNQSKNTSKISKKKGSIFRSQSKSASAKATEDEKSIDDDDVPKGHFRVLKI